MKGSNCSAAHQKLAWVLSILDLAEATAFELFEKVANLSSFVIVLIADEGWLIGWLQVLKNFVEVSLAIAKLLINIMDSPVKIIVVPHLFMGQSWLCF